LENFIADEDGRMAFRGEDREAIINELGLPATQSVSRSVVKRVGKPKTSERPMLALLGIFCASTCNGRY
jgi:hypothetical protein